MTFPEAGLQILEKAGHPMHFQEIAQQAIQEGLLSHVGQIPEQTMRDRLVALARRSSDRKLVVVGPGQFALTDWGLAEDAVALTELETVTEPPEEKPMRGKERHPALQKGMSSRSEGGRDRDRDRDRKKKRRLPPLSVVVAEILGEVGARLDIEGLLTKGRERGQMSDELSRDTLLSALNEENRRRSKSGGSAVFEIAEGQITLLSSEALQPLHTEEAEVREPVEAPSAERLAASPHLALESRRQTARQLRRRVQDLSGSGVEKLALLLLTKSGYRDARPVSFASAERERLYVARRRLGLTELRFLIQVLPNGREATRESVQALRSFMVEAEAHAGVVIGPGEANRDARAESQRVGLPLLSLLCSDSFIEELVLREVGIITYQASVVDDAFWRNFRRGNEARPEARTDSPSEARREGRGEGRNRSSRNAEASPAPVGDAPAASDTAAVEGMPSAPVGELAAAVAPVETAAVEPAAAAPAVIKLVNPIEPQPAAVQPPEQSQS